MPFSKIQVALSRISAFVNCLLRIFRMRSEPHSGARVRPSTPVSASLNTNSGVRSSSRSEATETWYSIAARSSTIPLISGWSHTAVETRPILPAIFRTSRARSTISCREKPRTGR